MVRVSYDYDLMTVLARHLLNLRDELDAASATDKTFSTADIGTRRETAEALEDFYGSWKKSFREAQQAMTDLAGILDQAGKAFYDQDASHAAEAAQQVSSSNRSEAQRQNETNKQQADAARREEKASDLNARYQTRKKLLDKEQDALDEKQHKIDQQQADLQKRQDALDREQEALNKRQEPLSKEQDALQKEQQEIWAEEKRLQAERDEQLSARQAELQKEYDALSKDQEPLLRKQEELQKEQQEIWAEEKALRARLEGELAEKTTALEADQKAYDAKQDDLQEQENALLRERDALLDRDASQAELDAWQREYDALQQKQDDLYDSEGKALEQRWDALEAEEKAQDKEYEPLRERQRALDAEREELNRAQEPLSQRQDELNQKQQDLRDWERSSQQEIDDAVDKKQDALDAKQADLNRRQEPLDEESEALQDKQEDLWADQKKTDEAQQALDKEEEDLRQRQDDLQDTYSDQNEELRNSSSDSTSNSGSGGGDSPYRRDRTVQQQNETVPSGYTMEDENSTTTVSYAKDENGNVKVNKDGDPVETTTTVYNKNTGLTYSETYRELSSGEGDSVTTIRSSDGTVSKVYTDASPEGAAEGTMKRYVTDETGRDTQQIWTKQGDGEWTLTMDKDTYYDSENGRQDDQQQLDRPPAYLTVEDPIVDAEGRPADDTSAQGTTTVLQEGVTKTTYTESDGSVVKVVTNENSGTRWVAGADNEIQEIWLRRSDGTWYLSDSATQHERTGSEPPLGTLSDSGG